MVLGRLRRSPERPVMSAALEINGLKVDAAAIGAGLYGIICQAGQSHIVAFGMIPQWVIESTEKLLREKIIGLWAKQLSVSVEEATPFLDEEKLKATIRPIVHDVTLGIYRAAKEAGNLVV